MQIEGKEGKDGRPPLPHGKFIDWVTRDLRLGDEKIGIRKADVLMNIARHEVLSNSHHWYRLPSSWRTLDELTRIRPKTRLLALIANGKINSGMTREEAITLRGGRKQDVGDKLFFLNARIAQLQLHITPLSDADLRRELRAEPRRITSATVQQLERLTRLAAGDRTVMRPFCVFYGGKWKLARYYGPPQHDEVRETFAGFAGYSTYWEPKRVTLIERDPVIAGVWRYLIKATAKEILSLPVDIDSLDECRRQSAKRPAI